MQMGKGKNSLLEYGGEKVGVAYFLNKLMLCLTVEVRQTFKTYYM